MNSQDLIVKAYAALASLKELEREDIAVHALPILNFVRQYHRHQVKGLQHIPKTGPALIVCNHSLATYDITCLMAAIYEYNGRYPRSLIDRTFFKIPGFGELMEFMGSVEGTQENAHDILNNGELLTVAPGGMREALKPSVQRYQIKWAKRKGFVKLAIETQTPVILAACPKADDLFDIYPSKLTSWVYRHYKLPFVFAKGLGPTPLPKPIKLTHFLSKPMIPPKCPKDPEQLKTVVNKFHSKIVAEMVKQINLGVHYHEKA